MLNVLNSTHYFSNIHKCFRIWFSDIRKRICNIAKYFVILINIKFYSHPHYFAILFILKLIDQNMDMKI